MSHLSYTIDENLVVKSNELIQASYAMTVNEQRLLLACISQIDSRKSLANGCFSLKIEQARDLFYSKGDQRHAYRDLQDASERLFERKVRISLPNNEELLTRFVQAVKFNPNEGEVTLRFAHEIKPYLSQLERNFTKYRLQNVVQLTSAYAIRIYELIVSWAGQNQLYKEIEITELRKLLGLERKYKQFGELKNRVIIPALKQINESTDFELDIAFKKSKRSYKWIQLRFNKKPDAQSKESIERLEKQVKRQHNQQAKAKREHQMKVKEQQKIAESAEFPLDGTYIKINGIIAQMQGRNALYKDENKRLYTIPEIMLVKAIKDNTLEIVNSDDMLSMDFDL